MAGKRLKILMTADTLGGVWNYSLDLCRSLRPFDIEIHLAAMGAPLDKHQKRQAIEACDVTIHESDYKMEWMENPWDDLKKARKWLDEISRDINPDIIHFNNYGQVDAHWNKPNLTVFHSCVLSWWRAVKQEEAPEEWNAYKKTVAQALSCTDLAVSPTRAFLKEIETIYGTASNAQVIYNGRHVPATSAATKQPLVFSAGRIWDEAKNMTALIGIADQLEWPVYIAGKNGHPVTGKVAEIGNVRFLGSISPHEMAEWMKKTTIYALPAHYEPFGLSALEAAQAGCALVLGDLPSLRELWGDAALFVNQRKPEELKDAIQLLIGDEALRRKLADKAQQRASRYSARRMGRAYYDAYLKLLNVNHPSEKFLTENHI